MDDDDMEDQKSRTSINVDSDTDSDNASDTSDLVETLVAGRAKRATAGNRMSSLIEREEDDEVALLFAEAEGEEDVEFEAGGGDDGSDAEMDSSSDDDDQGPNAAGDDDVDGEKELRRQEKAERTKKRKAQEVFTNVSALRKKVKIKPALPTRSDATAPQPKKKSERVSWLPDTTEAPIRASSRKQTMANKEVTHARMKDNEMKRQKLLAQMRRAERDREAKKPKQLTQADRLAEAEKVEKRNSKSLNRWEAMEKKRAEERQAKLDALQNRKLEGPVFTWWSGKATWLGEKLALVGTREVKVQPQKEYTGEKRGRKKKFIDPDPNATNTIKNTPDQSAMETPAPDSILATNPATVPEATVAKEPNISKPMAEMQTELKDTGEQPSNGTGEPERALAVDIAASHSTPEGHSTEAASAGQPETRNQPAVTVEQSQQSNTFLQGIHEYASMQLESAQDSLSSSPTATGQKDNSKNPANKSLVIGENEAEGAITSVEPTAAPTSGSPMGISPKDLSRPSSASRPPLVESDSLPDAVDNSPQQTSAPELEHPIPTQLVTEIPLGELQSSQPTAHLASDPVSVPEGPPPPPTHSTRNLLILTDFESVTSSTFPLLAALTKSSRAEKFTTKSTAKAAKQAAATELCAITSKPARFRDPETGIAYADSYAYKRIQEAKHGTFVWSEMLGCYVGREGEVAKGVPKGFLREEPPVTVGASAPTPSALTNATSAKTS